MQRRCSTRLLSLSRVGRRPRGWGRDPESSVLQEGARLAGVGGPETRRVEEIRAITRSESRRTFVGEWEELVRDVGSQ